MGLDKFKRTPCGFCFVEYPFNFNQVIVWLVAINAKYMLDFIYVECQVHAWGGLDLLSEKLS